MNDNPSIETEDRALASAIESGAMADLSGYPVYQIAKALDYVLYSTLEFNRTGANDDKDLTLISGGINDWFSWITDHQVIRPKTIRDHGDRIDELHRRFSRLLAQGERMEQKIRAEKSAQQSRASECAELLRKLAELAEPAQAGGVASARPDPSPAGPAQAGGVASARPDPLVAALRSSDEWLARRRQELAADLERINDESQRLKQEHDEIQAQRGGL